MAYCHGTYFLAALPIGDTPITPFYKGEIHESNSKSNQKAN